MAPKILVVDDDPSISDMLTLVLETEGFDPVPVMDGNEAVPAFREPARKKTARARRADDEYVKLLHKHLRQNKIGENAAFATRFQNCVF